MTLYMESMYNINKHILHAWDSFMEATFIQLKVKQNKSLKKKITQFFLHGSDLKLEILYC